MINHAIILSASWLQFNSQLIGDVTLSYYRNTMIGRLKWYPALAYQPLLPTNVKLPTTILTHAYIINYLSEMMGKSTWETQLVETAGFPTKIFPEKPTVTIITS